VQVFGDVVNHSIPIDVVYFAISTLKRVFVKKRQSFPCNLQGINCIM
jgi:hypothetical protein